MKNEISIRCEETNLEIRWANSPPAERIKAALAVEREAWRKYIEELEDRVRELKI